MKNLVFLFALLSYSLNVNAQTYDTIRPSLSITEFEKLKSDFSKIIKTKLYQKSEKYRKNFLRNSFVCSNREIEDEFKKCLSEKLGNKKSKKVIKLRKKYSRLSVRLDEKFPDAFDLLKKATIEQRSELLKLN